MTLKLMTIIKNPSFRTGTIGFLAGSIIPLMFTNFYLIPSQNFQDLKELNNMKRSVGIMNWQVEKLEKRNGTFFNSDNYQDGLYWAGF